MARNRRPSFLKKQKEQQVRARAAAKREARRARQRAKATQAAIPENAETPEVPAAEGEQPES